MAEELEGESLHRNRRRVKIRLKSDPNKKKVISQLKDSDRLQKYVWMSVLNYTFFFVLSYVITYFFNRLASSLAAMFEKKGPFLNYNYLLFWAEYKSWDQKSIITIFASGIMLNLLIAVVVLIFYFRTRKREGYLSILLLWLFYFAVVRVLGGVIAGIVTQRDFGFLTQWVYLTTTQNVAIVIACAIILLVIGFFTVKWFLQTSMSNSLIQRENRFNYILYNGVVPFALGSVIVMVSHMPVKHFHELFVLMSYGLIFLAMLLRLPLLATQKINSLHKPNDYAIQTKTIIYTIVLLVGLRILLIKGITL